MRKSITLKTFLRSPLKTLLTFLLVAAALTGCGSEKEGLELKEAAHQEVNLYEKFLKGEAAATVREDYLSVPGEYPLEKGKSYTIEELGQQVNSEYLNPEYRFDAGRTSYDEIQYAYMKCPDGDSQNLLVKFAGLDIYCENDESYTVMVVAEEEGRLSITYQYDCWARSDKSAYTKGLIASSGSNGAGSHSSDLSVVMSNGKCVQLYDVTILNGNWISDVNNKIYREVFDENPDLISNSGLTIYVTVVGDDKYYQYDMNECSEEEKAFCENYIDRCHEEASIHWTTEEAVLEAINNRCAELGIDYEETKDLVEVAWTSL